MPLPYRRRHQTVVSTRFRGEDLPPIDIAVNNRGATRLAVITALEASGMRFISRSDWHASSMSERAPRDWDYRAVVLHHAGNSHMCQMSGVRQVRGIDQDHRSSSSEGIPYHYAIDCLGIIYEGRDIRYQGEHLKGGNTGRIGVVFLADFSVIGEASFLEPSEPTAQQRREVLKDHLDILWDQPTDVQVDATRKLMNVLSKVFPIAQLGGHAEFASALGDLRSCPGSYGLLIAHQLRQELQLRAP